MANRSSAAELQQRHEQAAKLLAEGTPRSAVVSLMAERHRVDRRTARDYVRKAEAILAEEIGQPDLQAAMAETVERLRRLAWLAESQGNLSAAVGAEKAAANALVSLYRADMITAARLAGHTFAVVEPTEAQRRKPRRSISNIEEPEGFHPSELVH